MCAWGDILLDKVNEILGDINGIKTYIDEILFLSKESFSKNIDYIIVIFSRVFDARLKANAPKFVFVLKNIICVGYVVTRDDIKPDMKKVQGIMDLFRPTTATEYRALIGVVQNYRDTWPRWSHLLNPLI